MMRKPRRKTWKEKVEPFKSLLGFLLNLSKQLDNGAGGWVRSAEVDFPTTATNPRYKARYRWRIVNVLRNSSNIYYYRKNKQNQFVKIAPEGVRYLHKKGVITAEEAEKLIEKIKLTNALFGNKPRLEYWGIDSSPNEIKEGEKDYTPN